MKATSFMKSRKFLGIPGFFSRMKERGALVKDVSLRFAFCLFRGGLLCCSVLGWARPPSRAGGAALSIRRGDLLPSMMDVYPVWAGRGLGHEVQ